MHHAHDGRSTNDGGSSRVGFASIGEIRSHVRDLHGGDVDLGATSSNRAPIPRAGRSALGLQPRGRNALAVELGCRARRRVRCRSPGQSSRCRSPAGLMASSRGCPARATSEPRPSSRPADWLQLALDRGANPVCLDHFPGLSFDENLRQTREVVVEAHGVGAAVEGELEPIRGSRTAWARTWPGPGSPSKTPSGSCGQPASTASPRRSATLMASTSRLRSWTGNGSAISSRRFRCRSRFTGIGFVPGAIQGSHRTRLREGQHLHGSESRLPPRQPRLSRGEPDAVRPAINVRCGTSGRHGHGA